MPYITALAADVPDMVSAFDTAIKTVQSDAMGMAGKALPVGLAMMGLVIAVRYGKSFFKSVSK